MRQISQISDKILKSKNWFKKFNFTKQLEAKDIIMSNRYKERKMKLENEALAKMKTNPKYFYT